MSTSGVGAGGGHTSMTAYRRVWGTMRIDVKESGLASSDACQPTGGGIPIKPGLARKPKPPLAPLVDGHGAN